MRHTYIILLLLAAILCGIFSCQGCKDVPEPCDDPGNPQCPNYDPCHGRKTPVSAAFNVYSFYPRDLAYPPSSDTILEQDTVLAGHRLMFAALDPDADSFEWTVGEDDRTWSTRSFHLSFPCNLVENQTLTVQLITTRLKDTVCAAEHILRDTVRRALHFVSLDKIGIQGAYEGKLDAYNLPPYQVTIRFRCQHEWAPICDCLNLYGHGRISFVNLVNEGCEKITSGFRAGFREYYTQQAYAPVDWIPAPAWLTPEELSCDLSPFGSNILKEWARDLSAKLYADGDSIEIRFTHLTATTNPPIAVDTRNVVFKGRRVR